MYLLFRLFGWEPQKYFRMGYGERKVVKTFLSHYLDDLKNEGEV